MSGDDFGQISSCLLIEVNGFSAAPEPHAPLPVCTMIADLLFEQSRQDLIDHYSLEVFNVQVLDFERTLTEKILALAKHAYADDNVARLGKHIRHFYDVAMILRHRKYNDFLLSAEFIALMAAVVDSDRITFGKDDGPWLSEPLAKSPVYYESQKLWEQVQQSYLSQLTAMIFDDDVPDKNEMVSMLKLVTQAVSQYDASQESM